MSATMLAKLEWAQEIKDVSQAQFEKLSIASRTDGSLRVKLARVRKELDFNQKQVDRFRGALEDMLRKEQGAVAEIEKPQEAKEELVKAGKPEAFEQGLYQSRWASKADQLEVAKGVAGSKWAPKEQKSKKPVKAEAGGLAESRWARK